MGASLVVSIGGNPEAISAQLQRDALVVPDGDVWHTAEARGSALSGVCYELMPVPHYDLAVIGSGPAGQKGAIAAAKLRKKVAVIDRRDMVGGCSLHLGTIPSKTMREAILYLTGIRQRTFYGADYRAKEDISAHDLAQRVDVVLQREIDVVKAQLKRNGVATINGMARFHDVHTIEIEGTEGQITTITADTILIACGTRPAENPMIVTDGERVFNSDQLLHLPLIPRELIVVGGGVVGIEYAAMMTALNTRVTLIDQRPTLLDFADHEIIESLCHHLREEGVTFRLGEKVTSVSRHGDRVVAQLESGKTVKGDALLYAVGRQATSMEQGRLAISHSLGLPMKTAPHLLPYGIYTIPEISMVGRTERDLTAAKIRYEVGLSRFGELARAQMIGDERGLLKLLFDPDTLRLLGVHVMGESATEIIHIGQAVLSMGGTIDYFRDTVFNYPTLAEAYKVAALNGMNKV